MSSVPELATACVLFAIPVTVARAERSFSKLKLIKTYHLRSSISQKRLDGLALLAIDNEGAKQLTEH